MTMTVNSGFAPYCTPTEFCSVFDYRSFAQLASDTDIPLASQSALISSPVLGTQLGIGAGQIEMACTVGARYDPADLSLLITPVSGFIPNGGYALIEMNASLAAAGMFGRRFESVPDEMRARIEDAIAKLEALEKGADIFPFLETQQAGLVQDHRETAYEVSRRMLPSWVARRCVGIRTNMLPPPGGWGN